MNCIQAPGGTRTMLIYLQRGDYVIEELTGEEARQNSVAFTSMERRR